MKYFCFVIILIFSLLILSCGTAHHFMPAQPLEQGKWQISVSWHYNFDNLANNVNILLPNVYGYYGLSDESIIGTGLDVIWFPTFFDVGIYDKRSIDDYWLYWGKINVFSVNDNPKYELGIGYSNIQENFASKFLIGIGYGRGPLYYGGFIGQNSKFRWTSNFTIQGKHVGISLSHQHGTTKQTVKSWFPVWPPTQDTVLYFTTDEVLELVELETDFMELRKWGLIFNSEDTLLITKPRTCIDCFYSKAYVMDKWAGPSTHLVSLNDDWAFIDIDEIKTEIKEKKPIIITRTPKSLAERIENMNGWLEDTSIGWGALAFPE